MIIVVSKIVFFLCIAGIIFIAIRKISIISNLPEEPSIGRISFKMLLVWLGRFIDKLLLSDFFQNFLIGRLEKSLRKFKIVALKIDNIVDKVIRKLKKGSDNNEMPR